MPGLLSRRRRTLLGILIEVVIIIVGILLSLAISEWFENRKEHSREHAYLRQLTTELQDDLEQLTFDHNQRQGQLDATRKISETIAAGLPPARLGNIPKLLAQVTNTIHFQPNQATFRTLESIGQLALIENNSIATGLQNLYAYHYDNLAINNEDVTVFRNNFLLPFMVTEMDFSLAARAPEPEELAKLVSALNAPTFNNRIVYNLYSLESTVAAYERTIPAVEELLAMIRAELDD